MCRIIKDARCLELLFGVIDSYKIDFEGDVRYMDDTVIFGDSIKELKTIFDEGNTFAFQNKTPNEKPFERNPEILWKGENHRRKSRGKDKSRVCSTEADKCRIHRNYESIGLFFCIARELDWVFDENAYWWYIKRKKCPILSVVSTI